MAYLITGKASMVFVHHFLGFPGQRLTIFAIMGHPVSCFQILKAPIRLDVKNLVAPYHPRSRQRTSFHKSSVSRCISFHHILHSFIIQFKLLCDKQFEIKEFADGCNTLSSFNGLDSIIFHTDDSSPSSALSIIKPPSSTHPYCVVKFYFPLVSSPFPWRTVFDSSSHFVHKFSFHPQDQVKFIYANPNNLYSFRHSWALRFSCSSGNSSAWPAPPGNVNLSMAIVINLRIIH